jgi:hypothetical protein
MGRRGESFGDRRRGPRGAGWGEIVKKKQGCRIFLLREKYESFRAVKDGRGQKRLRSAPPGLKKRLTPGREIGINSLKQKQTARFLELDERCLALIGNLVRIESGPASVIGDRSKKVREAPKATGSKGLGRRLPGLIREPETNLPQYSSPRLGNKVQDKKGIPNQL